MACLIIAGDKLNRLELGRSVVLSAPDVLYPASRLYDGAAGAAARFATPATADVYVTADLDWVANGGFESWSGGLPDGWTVVVSGTGAVAQETTTKYAGTSSARLNRGTGQALVRQLLTARAGDRVRLDYAVLGGSGTVGVRGRLINAHTGRYFTGSMWSSTPTDFVSVTSGSGWTVGPVDLTLESRAVCRRGVVTLIAEFEQISTAGSVYVDAVSIVPAVTFCSVHGHNLDAVISPQLRSSTDNFAAVDTLESTLTIYRPAFYQRLPETFRRYWRLRLVGTNYSGAIWLGEWVLGQSLQLAREPRAGWESRATRRQIRNLSPAGARRTYSRTVFSDRALSLRWQFATVAQKVEHEGEVVERTESGAWPLVLVPYFDEARSASQPPTDIESTCVLGHVDPDWSVKYVTPRELEADLTVAEAAFPAADEVA